MASKQANTGCGCGSIPFSVMFLIAGLGYWGYKNLHRIEFSQFVPAEIAQYLPGPTELSSTEPITLELPPEPIPAPAVERLSTPTEAATLPENSESAAIAVASPWDKKEIRGIYLSRYQATNRASEQTIRDRVRYYKSQGINTLIHGVWGNGCTMYKSEVMQQTLGYDSCPNEFNPEWLDWLIDEAHKQGMEVHAYFEKGIKLDKNSPIFEMAQAKGWLVPGIDKTYPSVDHYLLDVSKPEIAKYYKEISAEFVRRYPTIDAVQWDDYVGYHEELPGKVDRTQALTKFMTEIRATVKQANPKVSFDLCHHNPYWGKRYFDADWASWGADRAFIQAYNDANFAAELDYAQQYAGIAIADTQFNRLDELLKNDEIESVLIFPANGRPEEAAAKFGQIRVASAKDNTQ